MLGLSPREARRRFDAVIDFAELREFVDLKLKNYSSGMLVRLAFAVMIQVDADILLIDEVLAVGDAAFQQKCFDEFVPHPRGGQDGPARHPRHGRRAPLLRPRDAARARARRRRSASPTRSATATSSSTSPRPRATTPRTSASRRRRERMRRRRAPRSSRRGSRTRPASASTVAAGGRPLRVRGARALRRATSTTRCSASCSRTTAATPSSPPRTLWSSPTPGRFAAGRGGRRTASRFDNLLVPGRYHATPAVARQGGGIAWIDRRERLRLAARRRARARTDAVVDLPYEVTSSRAAPARAPEVAVVSASRPSRSAAGADQGPVRARRRPAPPLAPDAHARGHATSSCASSARRSATSGSSCGRCCCSASSTSSSRRSSGSAATSSSTRSRCCSASCSSRSSPRPRAARVSSLVDREALIRKVEFPRLAVPLSQRAHRAAEPRAQPDRGARLPARRRAAACG